MQQLLMVILLVLSLASAAHGQESFTPQLSVRGEAQLMVSPDQVTLTLGVITEDEAVKSAMDANSETMNAVIAALKKLKLTKKDYSTQRFSIQPQWSSRSRLAKENNKPPQIIGYQVRNSLVVKTQQLEQIGDIISVATTAGANTVDSIQFGLSNPREYREQAITQATQNALADAKVLASASGNQIIKVLTINLDNAVASFKRVGQAELSRSVMAMAADSASVPPIQAGEVSVNASVSVTYEIAKLP